MRGEPKHGKLATYKRHGCRCDECRAAVRAYNQDYWRKRGRPPLGNPCEVDGVQYPSQQAAAHATGKSKSTICYHLVKRADLSRLGKPRTHSKGGRKRLVKVGAREWPSQVALARYLDKPESSVRNWLRRGNMNALIGALVAADAREAAKPRRAA